MPGDTDLFEIMETTRAMRRLNPDPVPDALIQKIIRAGVCAANGGNTQRWRFLVIKDQTIKKAVQVHYNPDNPGESVLEPRVPGIWLLWIIPAAMSALAYVVAR